MSMCTQSVSKNNQGGFASLNLYNKVVHHHEVDSEKCHVKITAKVEDIFYLRPLS